MTTEDAEHGNLSRAQRLKLITDLVLYHFPEHQQNPKRVTQELVRELMGEIPFYSGRHGLEGEEWDIHGTTTIHAGSYALAWHGDRKDPYVVLIQRSETNRDGGAQIGMPGGFVNLDYVGDTRPEGSTPQNTPGEQPELGARRELLEELILPDGSPVIMPDVDRLRLAGTTIDYRRFDSPSTYNTLYAVELTEEEFRAVQAHDANMREPAYLQGVKNASRGEVNGVHVMKLSELMDVMRENRRIIAEHREEVEGGHIDPGALGIFTHPHEMDLIDDFSLIRFNGQELESIQRFLVQAKEELASRIPPPVGDDWERRRFVDRFSLEGVGGAQKDAIAVSIRIPSRAEAHALADRLTHDRLEDAFPDRPDMREYAVNAMHRMVDRRFFPPGQPRGWEEERQVEGKTVRFTAVEHDDFPLPEHAPQVAEAVLDIDGCPWIVAEDMRGLQKDFAGAVILAEHCGDLHHDAMPCIVSGGSGSGPVLHPDRRLETGHTFLPEAKEHPGQVKKAIIRHENDNRPIVGKFTAAEGRRASGRERNFP